MTLTISGTTYTLRDPAVYGTDVLVRENRKKRYLDEHPEDRMIPRELFRQRFAEWCDDIEGSTAEATLLFHSILIPSEGGFDFGPTTRYEGEGDDRRTVRDWSQADARVLECSSFEVEEVLNFFSEGRTRAYLAYVQSKNPGKDTTGTTMPTTSTSESSSPPNTKTD